MLGIIAGADPNDPTASREPVPDYLSGLDSNLRNLRVGIDERYIGDGVDAPTTQAVREALAVLRALGADVRAVAFPAPEAILADWGPNCAVEAAVAHECTYPARRSAYGPALAGFLDEGRGVTGMQFQRILLRRRDFAGRVAALFDDVDLLLVPVQPFASPTIAQLGATIADAEGLASLIRFTAPFDMSGHPTITLPAGFTESGTPVAFQLVAAHMREQVLVRAGRAFQRETTWHRRHPRL
ncbi:MAG: hypothetical protein EHM83_11010 [Burkholderiales bacterium]|nr:MAG: hypothetical protein EHM83_11010 [Burkholderiales bacterium]